MVELNFGRKEFFTALYRMQDHLIIPLLNSWISCHVLQIYIPKSKTKTHMHPFLLGILMATHSSGSLMVAQQQRVGKLKIL